jgi:dUTP pyrophosphatase
MTAAPVAYLQNTPTMELKIKYLPHYNRDWGVVSYAKPGDAGFDLRAALDEGLILVPGNVYVIPTGMSVAVPTGYEMQIRSRSGMASKGVVVTNAPGTVDSGYRGEVKVLLHAVAGLVRIEPGDRVAQAVLKRAEQVRFVEVFDLDQTERGFAGFGSTGVA